VSNDVITLQFTVVVHSLFDLFTQKFLASAVNVHWFCMSTTVVHHADVIMLLVICSY